MSNQITVRILLNGEPGEMGIPLLESVTVDWVENKVRSTFGVVHGTLSSSQDKIQVVFSLAAGEVYYFLGFQVTFAGTQ